MSIDDLKTFIVLYEKRSFTDAAFELNISQSNLSKKIKSMADELEVRLVATRNKRHLRITEDGELLYQFAIHTVKDFGELTNKIEQIHRLERGNLNVSYTLDALTPSIMAKLTRIMSELPKIKFSFRLVTYQELDQLMFDDDVDIVLANDFDALKNEFDFYELGQTQLGIFANHDVDLKNPDLMVTSVSHKYLKEFHNNETQIFPSFKLLLEYLKVNANAIAVLPISLVNDELKLVDSIDDLNVTTFLITPKNRDKRPIIMYIVKKFMED